MSRLAGRRSSFLIKAIDGVVVLLALALTFYLFIALFSFPLSVVTHGNLFLTFCLLLVFLPLLRNELQRQRTGHAAVILAILVVSLVGVGYVFLNSDTMSNLLVARPIDTVMVVLIIIGVFEGTRRTLGMALCLLTLAFIAYTFFGQYLPHPLYHPPITYARIMGWMGASLNQGIYGSLLFIGSDVVFMFILFGSVMDVTGGRQFFIQAGQLIGSRIRGGAAHTAVISSALFGTLSGSPVANVAVTGPITIPIMKKSGIRAEVAGAIEAIASSGGSIMPPVMGVVAFIMAGITGINYVAIAYAAIIPAVLYYGCLGWAVYLYGRKQNIAPVKERVDPKEMALYSPLFIVPFGFILVLLMMQMAAQYAAAGAILAALVMGFLRKKTRPSLGRLVNGVTDGVKQAAIIGVLLALSGLILSSFSLTAIGAKFADLIWMLSAGNRDLALFLGMLVSLIIGMAAPGTAAYILVALMLTPILVNAGISVLQAHFFALYFAVIGYITPPSAPSVLVSCPIAKSDFLKTGLEAVKLSVGVYIVPFLFVWQPALLGQFSGTGIAGLLSIPVAVLVVMTVEIILFNYFITKLNALELLLNIASLLGFMVFIYTRGSLPALLLGVLCLGVLSASQWRRRSPAFVAEPASASENKGG